MTESMFRIVANALDAKQLSALATQMRKMHDYGDCGPKGQTGFTLDFMPWIGHIFWSLDKFMPHKSRLRLDKSSCRWQEPTGQGALGLHQDWVALGCNEDVAGGIAWVPLCDIDDDTPTLEVCAHDPGRFLEHYMDEVGYSVIAKSQASEREFPLHTISRMNVGDVLLMHPRALHRTHARASDSKPRLSLDLRYM